jgi:hypothetical protein
MTIIKKLIYFYNCIFDNFYNICFPIKKLNNEEYLIPGI